MRVGGLTMIASEQISGRVDDTARWSVWTATHLGGVCTALAAIFLTFDTVLKLLRLGPAVQGTIALGYPADSVQWIGHHRARVPRTVCGAAHVGTGRASADRVSGR